MNQTLKPFNAVVGDLEVKLSNYPSVRVVEGCVLATLHEDGDWILTIKPSTVTRERPSVEIPLDDRGYVRGLPSQRYPGGGGSTRLTEVKDRYYSQIECSLPPELKALFEEMRLDREYSVLPLPEPLKV